MRIGLILSFICLIAGSTGLLAQETEPSGKGPPRLVVERRDFEKTETLDGVFIPAEFDEIAFWPEEYSGELLVLEVLAHGSPVNEGDVIARFEMYGRKVPGTLFRYSLIR